MSVLPWFLSCVFSVIQGNSISSAREVFWGSVSLEKLFLQCPMFLHSLSFLRESMLVLVNERQDNTKLSLKAQCTLCGRVKPVAFPCISRASLARQLQVSLSFTSVWTKAQKSTGWDEGGWPHREKRSITQGRTIQLWIWTAKLGEIIKWVESFFVPVSCSKKKGLLWFFSHLWTSESHLLLLSHVSR